MARPYQECDGTALRSAVDKAPASLEKNGDIEVRTGREYVTVALCSHLAKTGVAGGNQPLIALPDEDL